MTVEGGNDNQALIATLSRVKAVSQLRVSHDGPLVVTSAGGSIPSPASDFLEAR